jgi:tetratricopeptide (TPR) repeat protein
MTRAPEVVYDLYENGPANRMREYFLPDDQECLPTQAAVAWLILAGQLGVAPGNLPRRDQTVKDQHRWLRAQLNDPLNEQSRRFKNEWIHNLAMACALTIPEVQFLKRSRSQEGHTLSPDAVKKAVALTRSQGVPSDRGEPWPALAEGTASQVNVVPRMLLRDIESFTGREAELARLVAAKSPAGSTPGVVIVHAVEGMGGIGKTALVLRAAHQLAADFPDGQLFVDLNGYTPDVDAMDPGEALRLLLFNLGAPDSQPNDTTESLSARYRSLLADKRVVVVLDNAATLSQVEPLIPGTASCLVMVTSRHPIGLAGARLIPLGTPPPQEAARLFRAAAGPGIVAADDPNVPAIVALCGHLPLAVSILAARLARRQFPGTGELLTALRAEHQRLRELEDGDRTVIAIFELSYGQLPEPARRLFRRLGLIPGTDFDTRAIASLFPAGESPRSGPEAVGDQAGIHAGLNLLRDHNLLVQVGEDRYKFHDLVRAFARQKAEEAGETGLDGLLDFYTYSSQAADALLDKRVPNPLPPRAVPAPSEVPALATPTQASAWLTTEITNLDAAVREAARSGRDTQAVALAAALAEFLRASGRWQTAEELHRIALGSARRAADMAWQAAELTYLGTVERQTGNVPAALGTLTQAVTAGRSGHVPLALADALLELGITQRITAEPGSAEPTLAEALEIYQDEGSLLGQACASRELGGVRRQAGDFAAAERLLRQASALYQAIGHRHGQVSTLMYLGGVWLGVRHYQSAAEVMSSAVEILRELADLGLGDPIYLANGLLFLGMAQVGIRDLEAAFGSLYEGQIIVTDLREERMQAGFLAYLGRAYSLSGKRSLAEQSFEAALSIFGRVQDIGGEVETLNLFGEHALAAGQPVHARELYTKALALAKKVESRRDEADALDGLARCDLASAASYLRESLMLFESMNCLDDAARIRNALDHLMAAN